MVIPASLRRRYGFQEGTLVIAEEREDGVLIRPATATPLDETFRAFLLEESNKAYAALRADPEAWQEELKQRAEWDSTLQDGLDVNEVWSDEDRLPSPND